jgi:ATP-binding cassette, subfamily B, bacterial
MDGTEDERKAGQKAPGTLRGERRARWWAVSLGVIVTLGLWPVLGRETEPGHEIQEIQEIHVAETGDDGVACLAMVLGAHGKRVTLREVEAQLYPNGPAVPTALDLVRAGEAFGMKVTGVRFETSDHVRAAPAPYIAHVTSTEGRFPRSIKSLSGEQGRFVVVEKVEGERLRLIDPRGVGRHTVSMETFTKTASGVMLLFEKREGSKTPTR